MDDRIRFMKKAMGRAKTAAKYGETPVGAVIVKDGKVIKRMHLEAPELVKGVIKCKNPRCITSVEQEIVHTFKLVDREKKVYRCAYCDAEYKEKK